MLANLLGLGWWSAVTVGVDTGVFLCVLAAEDAVAAVTDALIGLGCFLGEPPSVTVGPTDCERPTEMIQFKFGIVLNQLLISSPLEIFFGLFCGLPFMGLPCREPIVFWGLPRCGLPVFDRGNTGINFSRVGDGNKAPSSTSANVTLKCTSLGKASAEELIPGPVVRSKWWRMVSRFKRPYKLPSVIVRLSIRRADPGIRRPDGFVGELLFLFSRSLSSFVMGLIEEANDNALNELRRDTWSHNSACLLYNSRWVSPFHPRL